MEPADSRSRATILGAQIDALSWDRTVAQIILWTRRGESRYVCLCNVHSVVTANLDAEFRSVINGADMATPDGMPVAWSLSRLGFPHQERINGPDLMWRMCEHAARSGTKLFFYGSSTQTLAYLEIKIRAAFPAACASRSGRGTHRAKPRNRHRPGPRGRSHRRRYRSSSRYRCGNRSAAGRHLKH